jgi:predicted site-specific integrase-resolvase
MAYLTVEQTCATFKIGPRTPENWVKAEYINAYRDQHGSIRYSSEEIEVGFRRYGPKKMRDGRKRAGRKIIPIVVAESVSATAPEGGDAQ